MVTNTSHVKTRNMGNHYRSEREDNVITCVCNSVQERGRGPDWGTGPWWLVDTSPAPPPPPAGRIRTWEDRDRYCLVMLMGRRETVLLSPAFRRNGEVTVFTGGCLSTFRGGRRVPPSSQQGDPHLADMGEPPSSQWGVPPSG